MIACLGTDYSIPRACQAQNYLVIIVSFDKLLEKEYIAILLTSLPHPSVQYLLKCVLVK